jgi:uncharacterized membrane protein
MGDVVTKSVIVKSGVDEAFRVWENFENFPRFMKNVKKVTRAGSGASHWEVEGPLGKTVEWDAETTLVERNKRIGWNTKDRKSGNLTTSGQVTFTELPEKGETQITVMMNYQPQAGIAGNIAEKLFVDPEKMLDEDLQNFKSYVEDISNPAT